MPAPGIWVGWLADAARLTGYPVVEVAGWRTRGVRGLAAVEIVIAHHTAGPKTGEAPSLGIVRDGRAGLSGPLSQFVLGRSGTVYVVAAGAANHAGVSSWAGMSDLNSRSLGIEAEDDGDGRWEPAQLDCYARLVAACLHYMRRGADRAAGHREVAIPAGRKVDPAGIDMPDFRRRVAHLLTDPLRLIPRGATPVEDVMPLNDAQLGTVLEGAQSVLYGKAGVRAPGPLALAVHELGQSVARLERQQAEQHARAEQLLGSIGGKLHELLDRPVGDVYLPAEAVRDALLEVLGGGLRITGEAVPMSGTDVPVITEKG